MRSLTRVALTAVLCGAATLASGIAASTARADTFR
jgi:hypothetical protein